MIRIWACIVGIGLSSIGTLSAQELDFKTISKQFYTKEYAEAIESLNRSARPLTTDQKILLAQLYFKQKQPELANQVIDGALPNVTPEFRPYVQLLQMQIALDQSRFDRAKTLYDTLRSNANRFLAQRSKLDLLNAYIGQKKLTEASALLNDFFKQTDLHPIFYNALLKANMEYAIESRDQNAMLSAYSKLLKENLAVDRSEELWGRMQSQIQPKLKYSDVLETPDDYIKAVTQLVQVRRYRDALKWGEYALTLFQDMPNKTDMYVVLAKANNALYNFRDGVYYLRAAIMEKTDPDTRAQLLYLMGETMIKIGEPDAAIPFLEELAHMTESKSDYIPLGTRLLLRHYQANGPLAAYDALNEEFKKRFKTHHFNKENEWNIEWKKFVESFSSKSKSDQRNGFNALAGDDKLGEELLLFYETKADIYNMSVEQALVRIPMSYPVIQWVKRYFQSDQVSYRTARFAQLKQLTAMGFGDIVLEQLRFEPSSEQKNQMMAALLDEIQLSPHEKLSRIQSLFNRGSSDNIDGKPDYLLTHLYPLVYWESAHKHGQKFNVDPLLILSVMREESSFNTLARSHSGARGLMQLMVSTAKGIANSLGVRWSSDAMLNDPDTNIRFGTYYLGYLNKRFEGRLHEILSGYNAGPGITGRWQPRFGTEDFNEYYPNIPFQETRNYVQRVKQTYLIYGLLYGNIK